MNASLTFSVFYRLIQQAYAWLDEKTFPVASTSSPLTGGRDGAKTRRVLRMTLERGECCQLVKASHVSELYVSQGRLWVTGTPSRGDLLLEAGQRWSLGEDYPYVVQALETAEISLMIRSDSFEGRDLA